MRAMIRRAEEDGRGKMSTVFSEEGVRVETELTSLLLRWRTFLTAYETRSLFVIMHARYGWTPIPKRAFPSQESVDQMCAMFASHEVPVERLSGAPRGFEPLLVSSRDTN
jgi:hypothetical protein